jgi:galactokinase
MTDIAQQVATVFKDKFSREPVTYFSPGRINLIGEHVDYNDGFVLPAAINKGIWYAVSPNNTSTYNFVSVDFDESISVTAAEVQKSDGWKNYVLSVLNEFLLLGKNIGGFDCVFGGNIPRGSGMSSSAAVEGGLAVAINELFDCGLTRMALALLCQRAEHNFPGVQCGIMDQFANMMGKKDHVIKLDCQSLDYEYFPLKIAGYEIVLINSMVHHSLASGEYNNRRKDCETGLAIIAAQSDVRSFRDIKKADDLLPYREQMGEQVYKRCLYVVQEIERAQLAAVLLRENDLAAFGQLMFATHEGLSTLYDVSCAELDLLAELARNNPQVIGARMMGGGFGGCTINIVQKDAVQQFVQQAQDGYREKFNLVPEVYLVETGDGVAEV